MYNIWRSIKRLNIRKMKKNNNLLELFDDEGNIQLDDDAVEVWFNHFSKLLGGSSVRDAHTAPESSCQGDEIGAFNNLTQICVIGT